MLRNLIASLMLLPLLASLASAQPDENPDLSARDLIESAQKAEQLVEEKETSDPHSLEGQGTPLATLLGLREALRKKDFEEAGKYLDRRYIDDEVGEYSDEALQGAVLRLESTEHH